MNIAFIQFVHYEYLGIMYLSACLKKNGHTTDVFIFPEDKSENDFIDEIARSQPDIVAFSVMTGSEEQALSISRTLKTRMSVYAIFGGPHPTLSPALIEREGVDCICIGEAEGTLSRIVEALATGTLPSAIAGAWFNRDGVIIKNDIAALEQDLAMIPRPDRSLYRAKYRSLRNSRAGFILGRGCPYHCTFCSNHSLLNLYKGKGPFVRMRSVDDVIEEISDVVSQGDIQSIYFHDDTFILDKAWVKNFCEQYQIKIGLPFSCQIRADLVTEELVASLARANCKTVSFGIETGDENKRNRLLKKGLTDEQIMACAKFLKKHGIRFRTYNILGLPEETLDDAFRTIELNSKIKTDFPWCSLFQPLPGTELMEYCLSTGMLDLDRATDQSSFFRSSMLHLQSRDEIINLHKFFFYAVKFPFLHPVIRRAIRARPNRLYDLAFALSHAWIYWNSELVSFSQLLRIGAMNVRRFLGGRHVR